MPEDDNNTPKRRFVKGIGANLQIYREMSKNCLDRGAILSIIVIDLMDKPCSTGGCNETDHKK
jgi:hypothetical protein